MEKKFPAIVALFFMSMFVFALGVSYANGKIVF